VDRTAPLIARHFPGSDSELRIDGVPVREVAERFGTPFYVYSESVMDEKWAALRGALPPEFSIYYSVKANPNEAILRHFLAKGCGLEVASAGELGRAIEAGCPPKRILFAGPGKTEAELEHALRADVGEIHVESAREAERISTLARRLQIRARAALRINPAAEAQGGAMRMGGKPAPFGVDEESLEPVLDLLLADPAIEFRGLHLFTGTQILDHAVLIGQYRHALGLARRVAQRIGRPLATLDLGGGLGIPYFPGETVFDIEGLSVGLAALMAEVRDDPWLVGTRYVVEPGRYLVGEAGIYVARVTDVKVSRGKTFVVLDGGLNHHLAASGNLGQVIKRNFPIALVNRLDEAPVGPADVVGPLCTPLDTLARELRLPGARVGDLIGVFQSGAYGLTASPIEFLGHPAPAEVLAGRGRLRLIRARGGHSEGALSPVVAS
jgi:diaminopimelate decarboxylase